MTFFTFIQTLPHSYPDVRGPARAIVVERNLTGDAVAKAYEIAGNYSHLYELTDAGESPEVTGIALGVWARAQKPQKTPAAVLAYKNGKTISRWSKLLDCLPGVPKLPSYQQISTVLDDYSDVVDGGDGVQLPNFAMSALVELTSWGTQIARIHRAIQSVFDNADDDETCRTILERLGIPAE